MGCVCVHPASYAAAGTAGAASSPTTKWAKPSTLAGFKALPPGVVQVVSAGLLAPPEPSDVHEFINVVVSLPSRCVHAFELGRELAQWFLTCAAKVSSKEGTCSAVWHVRPDDQQIVVVARFVTDAGAHPHSLQAIAKQLETPAFPDWLPQPLTVGVYPVNAALHAAGLAEATAQAKARGGADADLAELAAHGWVQCPIARKRCKVRFVGASETDVLCTTFIVRLATLDEPSKDLAVCAQQWVSAAFTARTRALNKLGTWDVTSLIDHSSRHFVSVLAEFIADADAVVIPHDPCLVLHGALLSSKGLGSCLCDAAFPDALAPVLCVGVSPVPEKYMREQQALARALARRA